MNIPFYRHVRDGDDGHVDYQCLHCNMYIYSVSYFDPKYCCYCGVEYKGYFLSKRKDWIYRKYEKLVYFIQKKYIPSDGDNKYGTWQNSSYEIESRKHAIRRLKERREDDKEKKKNEILGKLDLGIYIYRIIAVKKEHTYSVIIDLYKYYEKTGKIFDRNVYEK
jgi:hypothetical protein